MGCNQLDLPVWKPCDSLQKCQDSEARLSIKCWPHLSKCFSSSCTSKSKMVKNRSLRGFCMPGQGRYQGQEAFCGSSAKRCVHNFLQDWGPRCSPLTQLSLSLVEVGKRATGSGMLFNRARGVVLVCFRTTCCKDPLWSSSPWKDLERVKFLDWTRGVSRRTPETTFNSSDRSSYLRLLKTSNWIFKAKNICVKKPAKKKGGGGGGV